MIVAGFGFRRDASIASLKMALMLAQQEASAVTGLTAPHDKCSVLRPLAVELGLPLIAVSPADLIGMRTRTVSASSLRARGTGSVAEAAALAAAGAQARLLCTRRISPDRMATCAIATGIPQ